MTSAPDLDDATAIAAASSIYVARPTPRRSSRAGGRGRGHEYYAFAHDAAGRALGARCVRFARWHSAPPSVRRRTAKAARGRRGCRPSRRRSTFRGSVTAPPARTVTPHRATRRFLDRSTAPPDAGLSGGHRAAQASAARHRSVRLRRGPKWAVFSMAPSLAVTCSSLLQDRTCTQSNRFNRPFFILLDVVGHWRTWPNDARAHVKTNRKLHPAFKKFDVRDRNPGPRCPRSEFYVSAPRSSPVCRVVHADGRHEHRGDESSRSERRRRGSPFCRVASPIISRRMTILVFPALRLRHAWH